MIKHDVIKMDKIKGLSFHSKQENWIGIGFYNGNVSIYDFQSQTFVRNYKDGHCVRSVDFHPI